MNMSNSEKDEFIRKTLTNDKYMASGDEVKDRVKKDIDISKIKLKKYTFGERRFIKFLGVLLVVSLVSNAYLLKSKNANTVSNNNNELLKSVAIQDDLEETLVNTSKEDVKNETIQNDVIENNTVPKEVTIPKVDVKENIDIKDTELNEDNLKEELTRYCMTIGRFGEDADEIEKNTIMLLIANDFFNDKVSENSGLEVSSNGKYAMTADNVHLYLKELAGVQVEEFLNSYVNYMKYNEKSEFYSSSVKSTDLKDEKYTISNLKVISNSNNEYLIEADLLRESIAEFQEKKKTWTEEVKAEYSLNATVVFNKDYTYTPYFIKDFKAELKPGQQDNINRLVDIEKQEENINKK